MNAKTIAQIAQNPETKWYYNQKEAAALLGCSRQTAAVFLSEAAVPYHRIDGKSKTYFLGDILEAVERVRWKDSARRA